MIYISIVEEYKINMQKEKAATGEGAMQIEGNDGSVVNTELDSYSRSLEELLGMVEAEKEAKASEEIKESETQKKKQEMDVSIIKSSMAIELQSDGEGEEPPNAEKVEDPIIDTNLFENILGKRPAVTSNIGSPPLKRTKLSSVSPSTPTNAIAAAIINDTEVQRQLSYMVNAANLDSKASDQRMHTEKLQNDLEIAKMNNQTLERIEERRIESTKDIEEIRAKKDVELEKIRGANMIEMLKYLHSSNSSK